MGHSMQEMHVEMVREGCSVKERECVCADGEGGVCASVCIEVTRVVCVCVCERERVSVCMRMDMARGVGVGE